MISHDKFVDLILVAVELLNCIIVDYIVYFSMFSAKLFVCNRTVILAYGNSDHTLL